MKTNLKLQYASAEYSEQHELLTLKEGVRMDNCLMFGIGETKLLCDFLNQLPFTNSEYCTLNTIDDMCAESLDPDTFEKWESVKEALIKNRKALKPANQSV